MLAVIKMAPSIFFIGYLPPFSVMMLVASPKIYSAKRLRDMNFVLVKNEDAETSPLPKLPLEISKWIVYNHHRSNQRIFALSDGCHRKFNNGDFKL